MINTISSERAFFYSPFGFLKGADDIGVAWLSELSQAICSGVEVFEGNSGVLIYFRKLDWDTQFFGVPFFRIEFVDFSENADAYDLRQAFLSFKNYISASCSEYYIFSEIPCEDIRIIAGITLSGWRLVETRITCYRDDLQSFSYPRRIPIRSATIDDIEDLRRVAVEAVNHYDRFHADDFFLKKEADDFLAIFIENSVRGFADEVIVPRDGPANAFLTGNYLKSPPSLSKRKIGKMVLSAVSSERSGWYVRLIAELSYKFKEKGLDTVFMTTQATNRTVLKVWHRHGYQVGRCSHIFSTYVRNR
ncbi:hypothetical protein [Pulveribacter sp.]|uniref:hypothetical protein n=1 Tax=Pulveribacter sp. TaxID=2678893 RepID=UPI0028B18878|nr:hypothetical protein [Pulveribacter sp.]